ncbi:extracellular solute-binding protein [Clostridium grantii]|uniref:Putative aldouronate transport system substrate-binding protein n=1 Tax=Clostridium grantii DSM 8605 TaxID=1121316 RepID=A0A1M5XT01_9CLOT|nr:extracellular solute-binding protein [Clostridium grantii]SHI02654.1 putative aldouronate transport system substrate-binding protein [Clostridium grantii DSM 8605]
MNKKIISCSLAILLLLSVTACGTKNESKNNEESIDTTETTTTTYPIQDAPELTYRMIGPDSTATDKDLGTTPYGETVKKLSGANYKYIHPVKGQEKEQMNLMVASGEFPDIVEYNFLTDYLGGPEKAISDGVIVDLTELIPKYAPNLMKYLEANPEVMKMVKTDTGKIYNFPLIRGDEQLLTFFGPIVNKAMLDKYNLQEPETMDEWYTMLKTFKENGVKSPLSFDPKQLTTDKGSLFIGAYGIAKDFYLDENKEIKFGSIQPEYKEFLAEFKKWYEEGLIDADIASLDGTQITAKMLSEQSGASMGPRGGTLGGWRDSTQGDENFNFIGVKYPTLVKGEKPKFAQKTFAVQGNGACITTSCKDVITAIRLLDWNYSEEGTMVNNFGVEGESYNMVDGYPVLTDLILKNPNGLSAFAASTLYLRGTYYGPFIMDQRLYEQYGATYKEQKEANEKWTYSDVAKYQLPQVTPLAEESEELSSIMSEINTYRDEMFYKFIFGAESLDNYDKYVENIKNMNIDRATEIYTSALERYNKR